MENEKNFIDINNINDFEFCWKKYNSIDSLKEELIKIWKEEYVVFCGHSRKVSEKLFNELEKYFDRTYGKRDWMTIWDNYFIISFKD